MRMRRGHQGQARILVADWDQPHALALAAIVRRMGYEVAIAFSGEEAVELAPAFVPDLLITEVCMGGLDGIAAAAQITATLPDCRVLFLPGETSIEEIFHTAPEQLVYSFTPKPVHPLDLLNAIAYMLSAEWSTDDPAAMAAEHDTIEPDTTESRSARRTEAGNRTNAREAETTAR